MSVDVDALRKLTEQFFAALGRGDVSAVEDMYTENAVILPPNRRIAQGENIAAFWRGMSPHFQNMQFNIVAVEPLSGEVAREVGRFRFTPQREEAEPILSKYMILWQNVGGEWKISAMVWNRRESEQQRRGGGGRGRGGGGGRGGGEGSPYRVRGGEDSAYR
jgi:ketosteroid isomerase-like protein